MNITKKLCKNFSERDGHKPEIIVIHISAGSLTSMTNWFQTPGSQASSHYGIGKDGTILQYVEEDKMAWTNGRVNKPTSTIVISRPTINPNKYSLTIENEGQDLKDAPEIQLNTLVELVKDLAKRYNIPIDREHILGHWEIDSVNRWNCPSSNHSIKEKILELCKSEEMVAVPKKLLSELFKYYEK